MNAFDSKDGICELGTLVSRWAQLGERVRRYHVKPEKPSAEAIASAKRSLIVFRTDMLTELGGPTQGSSAFVLCTEDNDAVCDNEIVLVGDDIPEMTQGARAFAQVIIVAGNALDDSEYYEVTKYCAPPGLAEGFMTKSTQENIWCRVSKKAADGGLRFETLGKRLLEMLKADCPYVKKASLLYVVSTTRHIGRLKPIEAAAKTVRKQVRTKIWDQRGVDLQACTQWGHCGKCKNKTICDEVRRIHSAYRSA